MSPTSGPGGSSAAKCPPGSKSDQQTILLPCAPYRRITGASPPGAHASSRTYCVTTAGHRRVGDGRRARRGRVGPLARRDTWGALPYFFPPRREPCPAVSRQERATNGWRAAAGSRGARSDQSITMPAASTRRNRTHGRSSAFHSLRDFPWLRAIRTPLARVPAGSSR
jgi:hypothetical protein